MTALETWRSIGGKDSLKAYEDDLPEWESHIAVYGLQIAEESVNATGTEKWPENLLNATRLATRVLAMMGFEMIVATEVSRLQFRLALSVLVGEIRSMEVAE